MFPLARDVPDVKASVRVRRAETADDLKLVKRASRTNQALSRHLTDPNLAVRLYFATQQDEVVGWVRSIEAGQGCRWVSNMQVLAPFRRQGIGRALMAKMLHEDAELGFGHSVLLASHTGALLYDNLGYDRIGTLHVFHS